MIEELADVVLSHDVPEMGLRAGDVGVVVESFAGRENVQPGYLVELMTLTGVTVAVVDLAADAVRPVSAEDMPQARSVVFGW